MPLTKQQTTNIIENIEAELKFLKEFLENEENQSISLLDLINSEKSKELIKNTTNLQNIFIRDEDQKIKQAILDLFEEGKNKSLLKQLSDIKDKYEKIDKDNKSQIGSLINAYKNKQKTDEKIKYIYLRILFRKTSIANLAKLKLITDIIGQNESSVYIEILQNKFSEQGKKGKINFIHLNNIFDQDTEKELRHLGGKKTIKRPPLQAMQSDKARIVETTTTSSSPVDLLPDLSSLSEKSSLSIPSQSIDSKSSIVRPLKNKTPSTIDSLFDELKEKKLTILDLNSKITSLEKENEQLRNQTKQEIPPKTSIVKEGLDRIESLLMDKKKGNIDKKTEENENLIKELNSSLQKEREQKNILNNQIKLLNLQNENLTQEINAKTTDYKINVNDLQTELQLTRSNVQQLESNKEKIADEKASLKKDLTQLTQINDELKQKLSQASDKDIQKQNLIQEKQQKIDQLNKILTEKNQSLQESGAEVDRLKDKIESLNLQNGNLTQQTNDAYLVELEQEKIKNLNELQELQNNIKTLKERLISQKDYIDSKANYDSLKEEFAEQNQKLSLTKNALDTSNAQLNAAHEKLENFKIKLADASQPDQEGLQKEKKSMKDKNLDSQPIEPVNQNGSDHLFDPKLKTAPFSAQDSDFSSDHGSRNSWSFDLNDDDNHFDFSNPEQSIPLQRSSLDEAYSDDSISDPSLRSRPASPKHVQNEPDSMHFSVSENESDSEDEDELENSASAHPQTNGNRSKPTTEEMGRDATLEEINQGVNNAFKQENHPAIIDSFIKKFLQIATNAANKLLNDNANNVLPRFEPELKKIASDQITQLIFPYINTSKFKTQISESIYSEKLIALNYLEKIRNSAELIFSNITLKQNNQKYKDYVVDQGKDLLVNLCIKNLQADKRKPLLEFAKKSLEKQATDNSLQTTEYAENINKIADELVTKLLKTGNLQNILKAAISDPIPDWNLLEASQQKLQAQLTQIINHNFEHNFPSLHLDPILEKVKNRIPLSEEEIEKFPSELQYANTLEEFAAGLRVKYPNLSPNYENQLNEAIFEQLRLLLRENTLSTLQLTTLEANEIIHLTAEKWLEKKLELITKKSFSLKLNKKEQKDQDNKLQKLLRMSSLEAMAITHKSTNELKKELKKLHGLKLDATTRISKTFGEIKSKLTEYPNLITKDGSFKANLNNSLPINSLTLSDVQIKILLDKINDRLKNDMSKWNLLNNTLVEEIATDIISDPSNPFKADTDIHTLISNSLKILTKYHDLQNTLNLRKLWNLEIQQLFALTQKLKASSQFNQQIEDRISKIQEMLSLKENDVEESSQALPKGVYLPHKCRIIPDLQFDSTDAEEYQVQVGDFYKQDALKVGKTITFSQKLSNEVECKWSATLNNDKCLSFKTEKKRFKREKSYIQEVSFAQMIYSVNSFKNAKTCTLNFGNCSQNMKEKLYLFTKAYNELRLEDNELQKRPKVTCNIKNPPNLDKTKIASVKEEIKAQLNLHADELEDISAKLRDDTMRQQIIRSRG